MGGTLHLDGARESGSAAKNKTKNVSNIADPGTYQIPKPLPSKTLFPPSSDRQDPPVVASEASLLAARLAGCERGGA